jgi:hypothetical protein
LTSWQLDFKDVSTVPADPDGKRAHVVEVLDVPVSAVSRAAPSVFLYAGRHKLSGGEEVRQRE